MILSFEKKNLLEMDEAFNFTEIRESIAAQQLEAFSIAKLIYGPQIFCFDKEAKIQMDSDAKKQGSALLIKSALQLQYEAQIRQAGSLSFDMIQNERLDSSFKCNG